MRTTLLHVLLPALLLAGGGGAAQAQGGLRHDRAKNHNLYIRAELASGNIYPMAASMVTGLFNYWLDRPVFETSYAYSFLNAHCDGQPLDVARYKASGITARDLFNDIEAGLKVGWQTYTTRLFNWGVYASGHYKIDQFKVQAPGEEAYDRHRIHRAQLGLNAFTTIGSMDSPLKATIEAGCRYNIGCLYHSPYGDDAGSLNNGLTSHFALKLAGEFLLQDIGVFANINHYNLLRGQDVRGGVDDIGGWTIGLTFSLTPTQISNKRY